jgi:hypothetical protein
MSLQPPTCSTCMDPYNEGTQCPRALSCGHSLCHDCLCRLIRSDTPKRCPECRGQIRLNSHPCAHLLYTCCCSIKLCSHFFMPWQCKQGRRSPEKLWPPSADAVFTSQKLIRSCQSEPSSECRSWRPSKQAPASSSN